MLILFSVLMKFEWIQYELSLAVKMVGSNPSVVQL